MLGKSIRNRSDFEWLGVLNTLVLRSVLWDFERGRIFVRVIRELVCVVVGRVCWRFGGVFGL